MNTLECTTSGDPVITTQGKVKVAVGGFGGGKLEGIKFAYPTFASGSDADAFLGAEAVASILNAAIKLRVANKVKNQLDETPDNDLNLVKNTVVDGVRGLAFTVSDALGYKVGERQPSLKAQIESALEEAYNKLSSGNISAEEATELLKRIGALQARRMASKK